MTVKDLITTLSEFDVNAAINIAKRVRGEWFTQNGN